MEDEVTSDPKRRLMDAAMAMMREGLTPTTRELVDRAGVNLSAIRNRAEPDIYMQPDDHIIIGTNFWAQPLAVVRNGFRATYGFGFLLDRNFGNDVFGPPPTNIGNFN